MNGAYIFVSVRVSPSPLPSLPWAAGSGAFTTNAGFLFAANDDLHPNTCFRTRIPTFSGACADLIHTLLQRGSAPGSYARQSL